MAGTVRVLCVTLAACGRVGFAPAMVAADAPGADAPDALVPRVDCASRTGAVFCDGFEDPTLAVWTLRGTVAQVDEQTHVGAGSLRADAVGAQQRSEAWVESFGEISTAALYVRGYVYVPSGFDVEHMDVITANGTGGGISVFGYRDDLSIYQNIDGSSTTQGPSLPRDRWLCLELGIDIAQSGGAITLQLDGVQVVNVTNLDTLPGTGFTRVAVGIPWTDGLQAIGQTYVDEVVIDRQPIGCDEAEK